MADLIPVAFRKQGAPQLATYDFYDLATGTGYKNFYGCQLVKETSSVYVLVTNTEIKTNAQQGATYTSGFIDLDFDLTFQVPTVVKGVATATIPFGYVSAGYTGTLGAQLYKVVNGVESQLDKSASYVSTWSAVGTGEGDIFAPTFTLPQTIFHPGEKLRLSVQIPDMGVQWVYHDPSNRIALGYNGDTLNAYSALGTRLVLNLPIKIAK